MIDIKKILGDRIPSDSSDQADVFFMLKKLSDRDEVGKTPRILDFGAGAGDSWNRIRRAFPSASYVGVDIESSPEVNSRKRDDLEFHSYDGEHLPFEDQSFDIVFSKQVLEHVRYPDQVMSEISRVLKPGGYFVASCSQLEPYHSFSIFNWTAYGVVTVVESHGMQVTEIRPGIDGVTMIFRILFGKEKFSAFFGSEGLFNHYINGSMRDASHWDRNYNKLLIAGHITWVARKA